MDGAFRPASLCLAELIARHKQALAMRGAGGVKVALLGVWLVIPELVLS